MKEKIISIDQGTSSTRSVLYDHNGQFLASAQEEFDQYFPEEGWVEHNPDQIWQTVLSTLQSLILENSLSSSDIASIGITNQRETTVVWNKKTGQPIHNAIVWQDRRTSSFCEELASYEKVIHQKTGLTIDPYFSATKVHWLLNNVEGAKALSLKGDLLFGTIDTFLLWKLTQGQNHMTDVTNASRTMLFNIIDQKWDEELLGLFEIPSNMLPQVYDNVADFGITNVLGGEIAIGGIAGDQQAALIGQCCFDPGDVKSTYGTGCFMIVNSGDQALYSDNKLLTTIGYRIKGNTTYALEGSIFVAGSAIQWLRDNLRFLRKSNESEELFKKSKANNLYFVPALTGLGAPYWNPNARGTIVGLTRDTKREDIVKAALESLSYQTYELIECMEKDSNVKISEIKVDGGMIDNKSFLQSLSDITQIKIIRPKNIETTSLGAAYLAGIQAGIIKNISDIKKLWKEKSVSLPKLKNKLAKSQIKDWKYIIKNINDLY